MQVVKYNLLYVPASSSLSGLLNEHHNSILSKRKDRITGSFETCEQSLLDTFTLLVTITIWDCVAQHDSETKLIRTCFLNKVRAPSRNIEPRATLVDDWEERRLLLRSPDSDLPRFDFASLCSQPPPLSRLLLPQDHLLPHTPGPISGLQRGAVLDHEGLLHLLHEALLGTEASQLGVFCG